MEADTLKLLSCPILSFFVQANKLILKKCPTEELF